MESLEVTLPIGFSMKNGWHRTANLRRLSGKDECGFVKTAEFLLPVERSTLLLTLCLTRLGSKPTVNADDVRFLAIGDRDALLLHLRRLMYGNKIRSILRCPEQNCGERMELDITVDDLLVPPNNDAKEIYEEEIGSRKNKYKVIFRLPTSADQEAIARLVKRDPATASKLLLRRCIKDIKKNGSIIKLKNNLPVSLAHPLSKRMSELDPQADIILNLTCPSCQHSFSANFDIGDFFFKEIVADSNQLFREVHVLALYYHWKEEDILGMSSSKRRMYLRFLSDALYTE